MFFFENTWSAVEIINGFSFWLIFNLLHPATFSFVSYNLAVSGTSFSSSYSFYIIIFISDKLFNQFNQSKGLLILLTGYNRVSTSSIIKSWALDNCLLNLLATSLDSSAEFMPNCLQANVNGMPRDEID